MMTWHANRRIFNRLEGIEINTKILDQWCDKCQRGTCAVVVKKLDTEIYDKATGSNGDLVVGIIRNGKVTTILLRRSTQEITAEKFFVDFLVWEI